MLLLSIALVVLLFDPQADDSFALTKSVASHATAFVLAPLLLFLVMRHRSVALSMSPIHVSVLAVLAAAACSSLFAVDRSIALFGTERRYLGLSQLATGTLLYFAGVILLKTSRDVRRIAVGMAGVTVIVAVYALVQGRGVDFVRYKEGITPISTLGQPDTLGGFLSIAASSAAAFATFIATGRRWRAVLYGLALLALLAALTTGVRNGLLAIAGAATAWWILVAAARGHRRPRLRALAAVAVVSIALLALSPVAPRLSPETLMRDPSVIGRLEIWKVAVAEVAKRPLLGVGPDNFGAVYPTARSEQAALVDGVGVLQNSPHDWILFQLLAGGLIGTVAFIVSIVFAVAAAVRLARVADERALLLVPLAAYLGQGLVNINDISLEWWFWLPLGGLAAATGQRRALPFKAAPLASAALVTAVLIAAGLLAANAQRSRLEASEANGVAQSLLAAQRPLDATRSAQQAILLDGARTRYWMTFGSALAAAGNPSAAANAFQQVIDRQPWNSLAYRNLGFQRLAQADERGGLDALARALERDPYDAQALDLSARLAYNRGDYERAAAQGATAVRVAPQLVTAYDAPVNAYLQLQRPAEAESLLTASLSSHPDGHLYVLLAKVRVARNDRPGALDAVERALAIDPNDADAKALRAQLTR